VTKHKAVSGNDGTNSEVVAVEAVVVAVGNGSAALVVLVSGID